MTTPAPDLTGEQQRRLDAIEAAPAAEESLRERVARAICESDGEVWLGDNGPFCEEYRSNADAALAVVRGEQ